MKYDYGREKLLQKRAWLEEEGYNTSNVMIYASIDRYDDEDPTVFGMLHIDDDSDTVDMWFGDDLSRLETIVEYATELLNVLREAHVNLKTTQAESE